MPVIYRVKGGWCDVVALPDGRFAGVHAEPGLVVCQIIGGSVLWEQAIQTDFARYLRGACSPDGEVGAIGVGGNDVAYLVTRTSVEPKGTAFGQNPVGLYWSDTWVPVIQRSNRTYSVRDTTRDFLAHLIGTSQGFRDVTPDGSMIFGDEAHLVVVRGVTLHKPCSRGGLIVGQIDGTDRIDGFSPDRTGFSAIPGPAFEPHCAEGVNGQFAICARTAKGAAFLIVPPFPPVIAPPPPPDPQPHDPEPEPTVEIPNHRAIVERVNSEHPHLVAQNTADTVREFYWRAVTALHAHDPKWGMLTKSQSENHQVIAGQRVAVDAVAYQGADQVVDVLKAAGDGPGKGGVTWTVAHRRASNLWLDPPPFPSGGDDGDPGDEDDQEPPPVEDDEALDELSDKLTILRIEHDAQRAKVSALESRVTQMQQQIDQLLDEDPGTDDSAAQLRAIRALLEKVAAKLGV